MVGKRNTTTEKIFEKKKKRTKHHSPVNTKYIYETTVNTQRDAIVWF